MGLKKCRVTLCLIRFIPTPGLPRNMPIGKKWSRASAQHVKSYAPTSGGVYELKAFGELVYIGKANNLRRRLLEHLNERSPNYYRFQKSSFLQSPSRLEKKHLAAYGSSDTEMPAWNNRDPRR